MQYPTHICWFFLAQKTYCGFIICNIFCDIFDNSLTACSSLCLLLSISRRFVDACFVEQQWPFGKQSLFLTVLISAILISAILISFNRSFFILFSSISTRCDFFYFNCFKAYYMLRYTRGVPPPLSSDIRDATSPSPSPFFLFRPHPPINGDPGASPRENIGIKDSCRWRFRAFCPPTSLVLPPPPRISVTHFASPRCLWTSLRFTSYVFSYWNIRFTVFLLTTIMTLNRALLLLARWRSG